MGDQHPPARAHNRIETEKRLVGKADEREYRLSKAPAGRVQVGSEVLAQKHVARLLQHFQKRGKQRRNQDDPEHR